MRTSDFDFHLPPELIAQEPAQPRGSSRLLALDRATGEVSDRVFCDLPSLLRSGDLLVVNDTRVIPARMFGKKESGGSVEILLLQPRGEGRYVALVRAAKRTKPGARIALEGSGEAVVLEALGEGRYLVGITGEGGPEATVERVGRMPLPPYIRRPTPRAEDREWYQTVYAQREKTSSSAAPTAGLHFTPELLKALDGMGVERVSVTLEVGLGTFSPVRVEEVADHEMHAERCEVSVEAAQAVNRALDEGRRVVAVGTTAARTLEHAGQTGRVEAGTGETRLFITPGYAFKVVSGLITNFHLPQSTLIMLVSALAGHHTTMRAYRHAVERGYRFYSYGDAMWVG